MMQVRNILSERLMPKLQGESMIFIGWMLIVGFFIGFAAFTSNPLIAIIPMIIAFAGWVVKNYTNVFYLFFLLLPFSIEFNFTPSLGTDLPTEPLMWVMFGISILIFFNQWKNIKSVRYLNAITFMLLLHLSWIFITMILSQHFTLSLKIFLAKLWYIIPFYFFSIHVLKDSANVEKMIKSGVYTLTVAVLIVLYRHYLEDFSFDKINFVVTPIFRNHVNYACIIVIFLPYLWTLFTWNKGVTKFVLLLMMLVYVVGIYFSFTRAAMISVVLAIFVYYIVKLRWIKPVLVATVLLSTIGISYLLYNNNYLRMNPEYSKTISHQDFDKLITATYKMEDISTMERVYRWVAGVQMIKEKPIVGFGPGTFYASYSAYTVSSFHTYVSDNPEQSTVHNYYLLTFIEQGFVGFLIFAIMCGIVLIYGESKYHRMKEKRDKAIVMAAILSFVIILLINLINDMIETDKVGPFFFLAMAIIGGYKSGSETNKINSSNSN
jgi:O-antigen ligase